MVSHSIALTLYWASAGPPSYAVTGAQVTARPYWLPVSACERGVYALLRITEFLNSVKAAPPGTSVAWADALDDLGQMLKMTLYLASGYTGANEKSGYPQDIRDSSCRSMCAPFSGC